MPLEPQTIGLPTAPRQICFHIQRDFSSNGPPNLSNRVHSLMPSVPFGVSSLFLPATPLRAACPAKVSSLFATSPEPSTKYERTPSLARFRPQAFSTSRRLAPPPVSWAYFIPLPRAGLLPFRGFSRFAAALTHRQAVPPCRYQTGRSPPRSAATVNRIDFEALLHESKRSSRSGLAFLFRRSPLRFHPPPGSASPP
jgi:hypothetical protein